MTEQKDFPNEEDPMWANMLMDRQSLMIGVSMDPEKVGAMFYLQVEDVDAYHAGVWERGGNPTTCTAITALAMMSNAAHPKKSLREACG